MEGKWCVLYVDLQWEGPSGSETLAQGRDETNNIYAFWNVLNRNCENTWVIRWYCNAMPLAEIEYNGTAEVTLKTAASIISFASAH